MPEKEREGQQNTAGPDNSLGEGNSKGTLGEAIPADVESAMREQARQKIDAILEGALKIYEEAKKTVPIYEAVEKADEFMDSAAREAGIGVGRVMELFTEKIPPDELARASQEVAAAEPIPRAEESPEPVPTEAAEPPRQTRPETEPEPKREISEEEKDAIVQTTLDVFRQELKNASVNAAEGAARNKFKEVAGSLDRKTYEELRQKITREINSLEAEERKRWEETHDKADTDAKFENIKIETPEDFKKLTAEETKLEQDLKQFNITPEQISQVKDFDLLTPGQKLLVMENLKQLTLGRIQEEATDKYKTQTAQADKLGRIWQNLSKHYQIAKLEKATAEQIMNGGIGTHSDVLEKLVDGAADGSRDVVLNPEGKLEIQYATKCGDGFEIILSPEKENKIKRFNQIATEFKRIPYEWSIKQADSKQKREFENKKKEYEESKKELLKMVEAATGSETEADKYIRDIEKNIKLDQFISSNPEVEKELQNAESQQVWLEFLKNATTERGIAFGAGFATRTLAVSVLSVIGAPVAMAAVGGVVAAAGLTGGFRSFQRAKETLREEQKSKRGGKEKIREATQDLKEVKTKSELVQAETLNIGIQNLIEKIDQAENENDAITYQKRIDQLNYLLEYTNTHIADGSINFGSNTERFSNQRDLVNSVGEAGSIIQGKKLEGEMLAKLENILGKQEKKQVEQVEKEKKYIRKQVINGALISAGFAAAGAIARDIAGEYFGWRGSTAWKDKEELKNWARDSVKPLGIDTTNGIDATEAQKLIDDIKKSTLEDYVKNIRSAYDNEPVVGTNKTVGEMIDEALKKESDEVDGAPEKLPIETEPAIPDATDQKIPKVSVDVTTPGTESESVLDDEETKPIKPLIDVEPIPSEAEPAKPPTIENTPVPPEPTPEPATETTTGLPKPEQQKEFVNPILGDRDSIWRSTEDTFRIYRDKLGYNAERDGDTTKWARKKTAEVMNELAEKMGGSRLPDIVHDNDKIIISIGEDGNPHLRFEESSGFKSGYFEEPKAEKPVEEVVKTREEIEKETETLQRDKFDIKLEGSIETEIAPNPPTFDQFKNAYEKIPGDSDRSGIVKQYILRPEFKNGLIDLGGNREKLNAFARMFDGNWEKIKDAAAIGKSVEEFNGEVIKDTNLLITGKFNEALSDPFVRTDELINSAFPVESKTGQIFYTHVKNDGSWRMFKADEYSGELKTVERDKLFGKDEKFSFEDVRKFLGFKENEVKVAPPETPEPVSEQIGPKGEKFVPPAEGVTKKIEYDSLSYENLKIGETVDIKELAKNKELNIKEIQGDFVEPDRPQSPGYHYQRDAKITYPDGSTAIIKNIDQASGKGMVDSLSSRWRENPDKK